MFGLDFIFVFVIVVVVGGDLRWVLWEDGEVLIIVEFDVYFFFVVVVVMLFLFSE